MSALKVYAAGADWYTHVDKGYQTTGMVHTMARICLWITYYYILDLKTGEDPITGTVSIVRLNATKKESMMERTLKPFIRCENSTAESF